MATRLSWTASAVGCKETSQNSRACWHSTTAVTSLMRQLVNKKTENLMQHVETFRLNICLASALTASESVVTSIRCMQFSDQKGLQGIPQQKGSSVHGQHCRIPFMLSISLQASQLDIRSCSHMEAGRSSLMPVFSCSLSLYSLPPSLSLTLCLVHTQTHRLTPTLFSSLEPAARNKVRTCRRRDWWMPRCFTSTAAWL